jgi:uncharacterized protein involved in exopolysaccharide biosynthesis
VNQIRNEPRDVSLEELVREVVASWRLILLVSIVFALLGVALGLWRPPQYKASVLLLPVSEQQSGGAGGLASLASRYAGVAALAGISLGGGGGGSEEAIAVLGSRQIASAYIESAGLLPALYAKDWDAGSQRWVAEKSHSMWEAAELFRKGIMFVSHDAKTGLVQLTVTWADPGKAAEWANGIVQATNQFLRDRTISESEKNIAYLTSESQKSTLVDARQAMFEVMKEEINRQMLARGRQEFALRVLDPAVRPEKRSSPGPFKLFVLLGGTGAFLTIMFVLARRILRN